MDQWSIRLAFSQSWVVLGGQATKSTVRVRPKTFFVLILDRSGICLPSILVLVQNFLQKVNQGPVHTFRNLAISCRFLPGGKAFRPAAQILYSAYIVL